MTTTRMMAWAGVACLVVGPAALLGQALVSPVGAGGAAADQVADAGERSVGDALGAAARRPCCCWSSQQRFSWTSAGHASRGPRRWERASPSSEPSR